MTVEYQIPTAAELQLTAQQKQARLTMQRPIFREFPITNANEYFLLWEQEDNYTGLAQIRGLNGEPPKVARVGLKRYLEEPGVYGEFQMIDERDILLRRAPGTLAQRIDVRDLVMKAQDQLTLRRIDRIEKTLWDLAIAGTFSVTGPTGATLQTGAYTTQTYDASTWATHTTAVPLADFQAIPLKARGYSVDFGSGASAYMNRVTANDLTLNTNSADLGGRRANGLQTINTIPQTNAILLGEALPQIVVYDEGYLDDTGTFQLFIPNGKVVVFGRRPAGQTVGEYRMVVNANNPGLASGPYDRVVDDPDEIPRTVNVHSGWNGGPVIYFPSAIVVMDVS